MRLQLAHALILAAATLLASTAASAPVLEPVHHPHDLPANAAPQGRSLSWTAMPGIEGAWVLCMATSPSGALLIGTDNAGMHRSDDGGGFWQPVEGIQWPCCNYGIQAIAVAGGALYAGTWGGGVIRSDDDGWTWYGTGALPGDPYSIVICLAPCRFGERLYAGGNFGVARTDDGGTTWSAAGSGLPSSWVRSLALRGQVVYAVLESGGVYRLDPDTEVWDLWDEGLPGDTGQRTLTQTADALFLATHDGSVFHLDCDDTAWTNLADGLWYPFVEVILDLDHALYAGTMGGHVFRWDAQNQSWQWFGEGLWNPDVRVLGSRAGSAYAGTFFGGVFQLDVDSSTWIERNTGLHASTVNALVEDGGYLYAGLETGGVWISPDQGASWSRSLDGLENINVKHLARTDGGVFAATWSGVFRSTDHGVSWAACGLQGEGVVGFDEIDGILYAGTYSGQVYSSDDGETWLPVGSDLPGSEIRGIQRIGSALYAATWGHGVRVLPDGETAWSEMNVGLPELYLTALRAHQDILVAGLADNGVWRWNDIEGTWEATSFASGSVFCLAEVGPQLMLGAYDGVCVSSDGGATWVAENEGLIPWIPPFAITCDGDFVYAGLASHGVWRSEREPVAVQDSPAGGGTAGGGMLRAYPNPFGRDTRVSFGLERQQAVRLDVIDAGGRRVATLADETLPAGTHERLWNGTTADGYPAAAGVYFLRLQIGDREVSKKTVHLR